MSTQTANLKLSLYEPDDAANLCDGYNDSMNKIDTYAHSNDANITTIDATLSSHTDKINTNATNISQEVTRAKLAEDTLSGTVNTLSTNVTKNSTDIASLKSSVSTDGTKITTNTNNIASLTTKTNQNTTDIATNKTNIASNTSAITKEISDRTTADAALQSKIDNLAPKSAVIYKYNIADLPGLASAAITGEANSNGYLVYDATYKILYFNLNFYFGDAGVTGSAYQLFTLPTTIPKPTEKVFPVSFRRGTAGNTTSNSVRVWPSGLVDCGNMNIDAGCTDVWIVGALPWGVFSASA